MGDVTKRLATDESLLLLVDAVKNTESIQEAKAEIQLEGNIQVKNVQDAASNVITDINQLAKNTAAISNINSNLLYDKNGYISAIDYNKEDGFHCGIMPSSEISFADGVKCHDDAMESLVDKLNLQNENISSEIEELNSNLADYGIDNVATTFYQGWYTDQGVPNTVRTDFLNCSAEDIVSVKCANTFVTIYAVFYDGSKNQLSIANASNTKELYAIAPNNSAYCIVNVVDNKDILPSTIGKVSVYVNNEIDKLKNDLGGLKFALKHYDNVEVDSTYNIAFVDKSLLPVSITRIIAVFVDGDNCISARRNSESNIIVTKTGDATSLNFDLLFLYE